MHSHSEKDGFSAIFEHSHLIIGLAMFGCVGWYIHDFQTKHKPKKIQPTTIQVEKVKEEPAQRTSEAKKIQQHKNEAYDFMFYQAMRNRTY